MQVSSSKAAAVSVEADALVLTKFSNSNWDAQASAVNEAIGGTLARLVGDERIKGDTGELLEIPAPAGIAAKSVLVVGLGQQDACDNAAIWKSFGAAAKLLSGRKHERVVIAADGLGAEQSSTAVAAFSVGCVGQDRYSANKRLNPIANLLWIDADEAALERGAIIGQSVNLTRELVNEPANKIYPESFAERAESVAAETGLEVEVWDEAKLKAERCGTLLAVARGSSRPARLVILRWKSSDAGDEPPLALIGKGVTFDSGGLSLKPSEGMKTMKCDMAGAATVIGAMSAIARLKAKRNVVAVIGLAENMVSGDSYKLGDVLVSRSGKTIEVLNTDAEGRLVLADALNVALDEKPSQMIDLATLTGACLVALGKDMAGLMTNNQAWCDRIAETAGQSGELAWQLPMHPHFNEQIKSQVADIKNVGDARWGGSITAAKFLEEFVDENVPWTHIDIAGPAYYDSPKAWQDAGGTGVFVRTLLALAEQSD